MELLGRYAHIQWGLLDRRVILTFRGTPAELTKSGAEIKAAVARHAGMQFCVGIGPPKTLAKIVDRVAKQNPHLGGVYSWDTPPGHADAVMSKVPVTGTWGIAGRLGKKLNAMGIFTVADLKAADRVSMRKKSSVLMQRRILDLTGVLCIPPETGIAGR